MAAESGYSQRSRQIAVTTPLGEDVLLLRSATVSEGLNALFEIELDLLSEDHQIDSASLLGQSVTLRLETREQTPRFFNGYVSRFAYAGFEGRLARYQATLVPWLWFLTRVSDCRIFQEMRAPDIIKEVFRDAGFTDIDDRLTAEYRIREYCVQYRETHYQFVCRLMETEGISWFFTHADGKHTLVLADPDSAYPPVAGYEEIAFHAPDMAAERDQDFIFGWSLSSAIRPGAFVHNDFDFKKPSVKQYSAAAVARQYPHSSYEIYDYPGDYVASAEGDRYAGVRIGELQADREIVRGEGYARGLAVGHRFNLTGYPREDQNREYLVTAALHHLQTDAYQTAGAAGGGRSYRSNFSALDAQEPYRPVRLTPRPIVQGPQTAIVVGPAGEEIWTDEYGRVKVQFHWDRHGNNDENSSCWIRVSHPWAGQGWGAIAIPRIGQEVIVSFLEGDPDRPMITGRVYNADCMPPFGLPAGAVVSGIKSNTHKGKGYNELTMDDTAGKEKITIHAQYDMNTTVEHDQTNTVHNTFTETIKSHTKITITEGTYSHDVKANTAKYHVQGALTENYDTTQTTTVKQAITIVSTEGPISVTSNSKQIHITAATEIQLHVGSSKMKMDSKGNISIIGTNIAINGSDSVRIDSAKIEVSAGTEAKIGCGNQNTVYDKQKTAHSGAAINASAVGMHEISGALVKIN